MDVSRTDAAGRRVLGYRPIRAVAMHARGIVLAGFLGAVTLAGVLSLALAPTWDTSPGRWLPAFLVLTLVAICLEFVSVPLPRGGSITVATIAHVATILLVPAPWAAVSIGLSVLVEEASRRVPPAKLAFNVAGMLLTSSLCSFALGVVGSVWGILDSGASKVYLLAPFIVVGTIYHGVNLLLTSLVFTLVSGQRIGYVLRINTRGTILNDAGATTVGALAALLWTVEPVLTSLLAVPGAVISRSFEHSRRLEAETRRAVRSLADIIDDRDRTTFHHSERVARYAVALGEELRLTDDELQLIEQAAAVHDLGKIGVPDRVLLKPGPLDAAERALMALHTEIGPRILIQFELFRSGAAIVRHHHESYDGSGYPDGLAGDAIPHGARVVAVADAYDAMTSDRPYRSALSSEEAVNRLRNGRGRQWDPTVVDAFLHLLEATPERLGAGTSEVAGTDSSVDALAPTAATSRLGS